MTFEPTWESVSTHQLPQWYDDAKLGIFLHWGLYSVPGWAPQVADIQELLRTEGPVGVLRNNPYAEWYRNTMLIEDSPTWRHQRETYGPDFAYDDFIAMFDDASSGADLDALAQVCRDAGARYVVLTTKHHDGFTLWPATRPHPNKGAYSARRDLVGDLSRAVRSAGMRMGLYYSGGYDWPFNDVVMRRPADLMLAVPAGPSYLEYATAHVRELIDRYHPAVLWNDICWPAGGNLAELFAHYYNAVPDGVVNDRWLEPTLKRGAAADAVVRGAGELVQALWRLLPADEKGLTFPATNFYDFATPEYTSFDAIQEKKWESTRGVGHSFGANRNERPEDIVTARELVRWFCDIVAKNGNLLIGIGPRPDGTVPAEQLRPLTGLGAWMAANSEAMHGSRPWHVAEGLTSERTEVRFTQRSSALYAALLDDPGSTEFSVPAVAASGVRSVRLLGTDSQLEFADDAGALQVRLPDRVPVSPVHVLAIEGDPGAMARASQ